MAQNVILPVQKVLANCDSNSSSYILVAAHQNTQTVIDATQKETAIDQQQHSCETLICQRHQTILRLLSSAAMAGTQLRVRELNCPTTYIVLELGTLYLGFLSYEMGTSVKNTSLHFLSEFEKLSKLLHIKG